MFETVTQLAEELAANVSRRKFLDRLGRGALISAAALGGILASPHRARAGGPCPKGTKRCRCRDGDVLCCPSGTTCRESPRGYCTCG